MAIEHLRFECSDVETLEPDEAKAGDIFSRLGYKIHDAIADLVDNSIDAEAAAILVRFVRTNDGIRSVIIADDGHGMDAAELREAMRFGSRTTRSEKQLGKYGIGLKSASLSQAESVTVLSRRGRSFVGRRWTLENVKKDWSCEVLKDAGIRAAFRLSLGGVENASSGTMVIWERLEHLRALPQNLDKVLEATRKDLATELGIRFHRFLAKGRTKIVIDEHLLGEDEPLIQLEVSPLDPFSYEVSGHPDYPITMKFVVSGVHVEAECHIWPPKSKSSGYRLGGGKVAMRQGFYFYRNDRVIQAGGWNGHRADDSEPHLSLARVKIDLPAKLDSLFKLDVTKSHLDPSPEFFAALTAVSAKGVTFSKYIELAYRAYRKQKVIDGAKFPFVPGTGIPSRARGAIAALLSEKGAGRAKKVTFRWSTLDHDEMFRVAPEEDCIMLNSRFRRDICEGRSTDAPVLKIVLMFLLQAELDKAFLTQKSASWLQKINQSLIAAMKG